MQVLEYLAGLHVFSLLFLSILHLILHVTENVLPTQMEDRMRVYETRMLTRISVSERKELIES